MESKIAEDFRSSFYILNTMSLFDNQLQGLLTYQVERPCNSDSTNIKSLAKVSLGDVAHILIHSYENKPLNSRNSLTRPSFNNLRYLSHSSDLNFFRSQENSMRDL